MILSLLLNFYSLLVPASYGVEIVDRLWQFERLERSLPRVSFEEAFQCDVKAQFQLARDMCLVACEPRGIFTMCHTTCYPPDIRSLVVKEEFLSCDSEKVVAVLSDGEVRSVTRAQYESFQFNPLRELFERLPLWFEGIFRIEIMSVVEATHTLGWKTESERKVRAWNIDGEFFFRTGNGNEDSMPFIATLIQDPSVPWHLRAARFRLTNEGTLWRLHDY
jgi:hypothetical protein